MICRDPKFKGKKKNKKQDSSDYTPLITVLILCHLFWKLSGCLLDLLLF